MQVEVTGELDELMEYDDWALIFGSDGKIKGIFIPQGSDDAEVPIAISNLLEAAGIDLLDEEQPVYH